MKLLPLAVILMIFMVSGQAKAADVQVDAVVFTWQNMSLMEPGVCSAQYVSVSRGSNVIQHSVDYYNWQMVQKIILYQTEDPARLSLLNILGDMAKNWIPYYGVEGFVDGSSWEVVIHYSDASMKEFKGYGQKPPGADIISQLVFGLAEYEIKPQLF